jgi:hypothetical protein
VQFSREFIEGFRSAISALGNQGDYLLKDWSEPYKYLRSVLEDMQPKKPKDIAGMKIVVSETVAKDVIEFHHADGRIERFKLPT